MARVRELEPGDIVKTGDKHGIFVGRMIHPLYNMGFSLVIWWLLEDQRWSLDALSTNQEVGEVIGSPVERAANLWQALQHHE